MNDNGNRKGSTLPPKVVVNHLPMPIKKPAGPGRPKGRKTTIGEHGRYPGCTLKESKFIDAYLLDPSNATAAARKAGYKYPMQTSWQLLNREKIRKAINENREIMSQATMIDAGKIIAEEEKLAFSDIRQIPGVPHDIGDDIAAAIASVEILEIVTTTKGGDVIEKKRWKYTLWPKGQALERLERMQGMYEKDNIQQGGKTTNVQVNVDKVDVKLDFSDLTIEEKRAIKDAWRRKKDAGDTIDAEIVEPGGN